MDLSSINYDKLFEDLDSQELAILKNNNKMTDYVIFKIDKFPKGYKKNDALWGIYNEIATNSIIKKEYYSVATMYKNMGRIVFLDKKYNQALEYGILEAYMILYAGTKDLGNTRKRDLDRLLNETKEKWSIDLISLYVKRHIPHLYVDSIEKELYKAGL